MQELKTSRSVFDGKCVQVGLQVIYMKDRHILLGQRKSAFGHGTWALPGGILEMGESFLQGAKRELEEETGIIADDVKLACICDAVKETNYYVQIGIEVISSYGEFENREPDRCFELKMFLLDELPTPLFFPSKMILESLLQSKFYIERSM
jgi:8-oxo-dGTP diphosphatase